MHLNIHNKLNILYHLFHFQLIITALNIQSYVDLANGVSANGHSLFTFVTYSCMLVLSSIEFGVSSKFSFCCCLCVVRTYKNILTIRSWKVGSYQGEQLKTTQNLTALDHTSQCLYLTLCLRALSILSSHLSLFFLLSFLSFSFSLFLSLCSLSHPLPLPLFLLNT